MKERELRAKLKKEKEEASRRAEASRREKDEAARRALEDMRRKQEERIRRDRENIDKEEARRLAQELKEKNILKVDVDVSSLEKSFIPEVQFYLIYFFFRISVILTRITSSGCKSDNSRKRRRI